MSRDIGNAEPILRMAFKDLKEAYENKYPGRSMFLTHVDRTPAEQLRYFCQGRLDIGRRVTNCDGYNKLSKHNHTPSQAIDIAIMENGVVSWDDSLFVDIGDMLVELGYADKVEWGGLWKTIQDLCHIQTRNTTV